MALKEAARKTNYNNEGTCKSSPETEITIALVSKF
jgi:hypothetical protein